VEVLSIGSKDNWILLGKVPSKENALAYIAQRKIDVAPILAIFTKSMPVRLAGCKPSRYRIRIVSTEIVEV